MTSQELTYDSLAKRATAKGIKTFGDMVDAIEVDPQDLWFGDWENEMRQWELYNCDAVLGCLQLMAQEGII